MMSLRLPVTDRALSKILFDPANIFILLEISVHSQLHLTEAKLGRYLTNPDKQTCIHLPSVAL